MVGYPDIKAAHTARPAGSKGVGPMNAGYAKGGPVIQEGRSRFMKTPDTFRTDNQRQDYGGGKDPLANRKGDGKSLPPIKPHT